MARATKLNDLQLILLTTASRRDDGSLLPPPERLANQAGCIRKVIPSLLKRALAEEVDVTDAARVWRGEGERRIGVAITAAGRRIIGCEEGETVRPAENTAPVGPAVADPVASDPIAAPPTKIANVLALLERPEGATLNELVTATGWLPHTTRAALTGLRKKGHVIGKRSRDGAATYVVKAVA